MSQNLNLEQKALQISPSMMTFKEYYMSFVGLNDFQLANGWGWFVDIEMNSEPIRIISTSANYNNIRYKPSKLVTVPKTINECSSIRSMKSMKNLHTTSMIFEMDEDYNKHITNNHLCKILPHCIGLLTVVLCYCITYR